MHAFQVHLKTAVPNKKDPIHVNPMHVVSVSPSGRGGTEIVLSIGKQIIVEEDYATVAQALQGALRD